MKTKITLLGEKLSHSLSPEIHSFLGDYEYTLSPTEKENLDLFFEKSEYSGFNVTIPYKIEALKRCDVLSDTAKEIGSVNTCIRANDDKLYGYNTDAFGFEYMLRRANCNPKGKKVVILGSGGSSKMVQYVMKNAGAEFVVISRTGENNYENIDRHLDGEIIVNTTPVGMFPCPGKSAVDISRFKKCRFVFDLIYNPFRTKLLQDGEHLGMVVSDGLPMLVAQAKKSSELFSGMEISEDKIEDIIRKIRIQSANIILVGMPGSGKTTVGKEIAKKLQRKFIDTDDEIEKSGKLIPEIIEKEGEDSFRNMESEVINDLRNVRGAVIATGGGAIIRDENVAVLRENGIVIFLNTPLDMLEQKGRPISKSRGIETLYNERVEKYRKAADIIFDVNKNSTVDEVIECICSL